MTQRVMVYTNTLFALDSEYSKPIPEAEDNLSKHYATRLCDYVFIVHL